MQDGPHLGPHLSPVTTPIVWFTSGTDTIPLRIVVVLKESSPFELCSDAGGPPRPLPV